MHDPLHSAYAADEKAVSEWWLPPSSLRLLYTDTRIRCKIKIRAFDGRDRWELRSELRGSEGIAK
jgi:hypothetical protein